MIKGGILHSMHLVHDECIGTATLKASQFFDHGFEGSLKLMKEKIVRGEPEAELRVKVEINIDKLAEDASSGEKRAAPDTEATESAEGGAKKQKTTEEVEKKDVPRPEPDASSCQSGTKHAVSASADDAWVQLATKTG